jgi:hypothetical protein
MSCFYAQAITEIAEVCDITSVICNDNDQLLHNWNSSSTTSGAKNQLCVGTNSVLGGGKLAAEVEIRKLIAFSTRVTIHGEFASLTNELQLTVSYVTHSLKLIW